MNEHDQIHCTFGHPDSGPVNRMWVLIAVLALLLAVTMWDLATRA